MGGLFVAIPLLLFILLLLWIVPVGLWLQAIFSIGGGNVTILGLVGMRSVSYTHLRAHET